MAFIDARLPNRIAAGLRIGPEWSTDLIGMVNGREKRNGRWLYPRWRATANMGAFNEIDREHFRSMFIVARGRLHAFRVKDPVDWLASGEPLAPSVGTSTAVQLTRTYTFPGSSETVAIKVTAPVGGTVTVYKDGSPITGTLDSDTGLFTPSAPWASGAYTWDGQYDRWMRFDSDWGALTANAENAYTTDIELVEVRR